MVHNAYKDLITTSYCVPLQMLNEFKSYGEIFVLHSSAVRLSVHSFLMMDATKIGNHMNAGRSLSPAFLAG